jgi:methionine aminotransferase
VIYPESISSKLPKVGKTIFSTMSALAAKYNAINLSQGFGNFPVSNELINLVSKYMEAGLNQYAPMQGEAILRKRVAEMHLKQHGISYNPETEIAITAGATQALFTAIMATVKEGDEVIVFTPAYDSYQPAVELAGGKVVFFPLRYPDYLIDWDEVKKLINRRTRMIIINTPHNPTGKILNKKDMQQLERITNGNDILILSDEVYEHLVFDDNKHQSVSAYPKLAERSFVIGSFGKTLNTTGWKIGYCMAPENLMREFLKVHQYLVFSVNTPVQHAIAEFLENEDNYQKVGKFYQKKRDEFISLIEGSRFKLSPSSGTYFQLLNYSAISKEEDSDFAVRLTKEKGVASIPVSVFYHNPTQDYVLRFCFAKDDETLEKAAAILKTL